MTAKIGHGGKRADLGGMYFRSRMEANLWRYYLWLKHIGEIADVQYESQEWEFPLKRGHRFYKCDFAITNKNGSVEYIEAKGWMDRTSATKLKRMGRYYPDVKITILDYEQYRAIAKTMKHIIPNWESGSKESIICESDESDKAQSSTPAAAQHGHLGSAASRRDPQSRASQCQRGSVAGRNRAEHA